jgi:hypothetical protein
MTNLVRIREVKHPLVGFPMQTPKFTTKNVYEPERNRRELISINHLPLANLLFDAAEVTAFSPLQRQAILLLVCASQVTAALPRIFTGVNRTTFDSNSQDIIEDIQLSVQLRAFLSRSGLVPDCYLRMVPVFFLSGSSEFSTCDRCGRSTEEIGLVMLYLDEHDIDHDSCICSCDHESLQTYLPSAQLQRSAKCTLSEVMQAMKHLFQDMLEDLIQCSSKCARSRLQTIHVATGRNRDPSSVHSFLEAAIRSAAKRGQVSCPHTHYKHVLTLIDLFSNPRTILGTNWCWTGQLCWIFARCDDRPGCGPQRSLRRTRASSIPAI